MKIYDDKVIKFKPYEYNYLDKLNKIIKFISTNIAEDKTNPFLSYSHIEHLDNKEEFFDWEVYIRTDDSINLENRFKWQMYFIKRICDYGEKNNCEEIIEKIAFII